MIVTIKKSISPFGRTRHDHANETAEDYVEAISDLIAYRGYCRITDLAEQFSVSHVTAHKIVKRRLFTRGVINF